MKKSDLQDFYPYGVSYYRPVTPQPKHWDKDLGNIKQCGFNTIRVSAFWSRMEKEEGIYDFTEFDSICDCAQRHGLKVLMTLYIVNMPEWMFEKYPDARMVSAAGRVQYSEHHPDAVAGGWPGLCMDCPEIMEEMRQFVRAITLHYKGNETILAFDVIHEPWEEPSQEYYIDSWKNSVYCYCEHSIKKFRKWLEEKYTTLENLNAAWSRCYNSWAQVLPPRNFGAYTDWLDWRNFSTDMVAEECMQAGMAVKSADPDRIIVNHCGGVLNAFNTSSDTFALAKTVDIPGASNYSIKSPQDAGMSCDFLRSASQDDGNFWIGETSGGSGPMFVFNGEDIERFFAFGMPWSKKVQKKHIWKMISHGAKGVMYWMWRPELYGCETAAMGFTDREGNLTERTDNAKEIADVIEKNKEIFLHGKIQSPQVAVLYNRNTSLLEGYASTSKSVQGNAGLFANYKDLWSLSGFAKMCMDSSIPTDYVNDDMVAGGGLSKYKLLVLPYSICIAKEAADKIKEFVRNGGTVVADALCGYFLENGWGSEVVPGNGLDEMFGCKVLEYDYSLNTKVFCKEELKQIQFNSKFVKEKIVLNGARPIGYFENGAPAVTIHNYGEGWAIYFATSLFMHEKENSPFVVKTIMDYMMETAGVLNEIHVTVSGNAANVEGRVLRKDQDALVIVMNHAGECAHAEIRILGFGETADIFDAEKNERIAYSITEKGEVAFSLEMEGTDVRIIKIAQRKN